MRALGLIDLTHPTRAKGGYDLYGPRRVAADRGMAKVRDYTRPISNTLGDH